MAVTVDKKAAGPVLIELVAHQRFVLGGKLYESDVAYECSPEEAEQLLAVVSDGVKAFRVYVTKAPKQVVATGDQTPVVPLPKADAPEAPPKGTVTEKGIHASTPEEEAALMKELDADSTPV